MTFNEQQFLIDVYRLYPVRPREIIKSPGFYMKQNYAVYFLGKWSDKGWYEWDVDIELGQLTDKGIEKAKEVGS